MLDTNNIRGCLIDPFALDMRLLLFSTSEPSPGEEKTSIYLRSPSLLLRFCAVRKFNFSPIFIFTSTKTFFRPPSPWRQTELRLRGWCCVNFFTTNSSQRNWKIFRKIYCFNFFSRHSALVTKGRWKQVPSNVVSCNFKAKSVNWVIEKLKRNSSDPRLPLVRWSSKIQVPEQSKSDD